MRFKRHLAYEQGLKQIDIAALMNVVFLLLVFILIMVGFSGLPGIRVGLPGLAASSNFRAVNLEIAINSQASIMYKGEEISSQDLRVLLAQMPVARTAVLIKADKTAALSAVMGVWKICQELGIGQVNIAATR